MIINNIIQGHINELLNLNVDILQERLKICRRCPLYSPKFGGMCNSQLWLNPEDDSISFKAKDGYVRGCGCRLLAKTTLPNESCPANKW